MKTSWNPVLALTGLGALLAYVLACTSFSPDDTKVLYPTLDAESGVVGLAVYDRASRKSEVLLIPQRHDLTQSTTSQQLILRPQWLSNGRELLIAWTDVDRPGSGPEESLNVALVARHGHGPARLFQFDGVSSAVNYVQQPLPVAGKALFLTSRSNEVLRLDLTTGQTRRASIPPETYFIPGPDDQSLFYLQKFSDNEERWDFGTLQADTLTRTSRGELELTDKDGFPIFTRDAKHIAVLSSKSKPPTLSLLTIGAPRRVLPISSLSRDAVLSNGQFSPNGKVIYAGFMEPSQDATNTCFGFVEIPLNGGDERKTILITTVGKGEESDALFFPIDISHDGRTLAACSTYLALHHNLRPDDCGLFLVDLTHPERRALKVPVPRPAPKDKDGH